MSAPSIRELIQRATPGPWDSPQSKPLIFRNDEGRNFSGGDWHIYPPLGESGPVAIAGHDANAQLIARLSPDVVLKVVSALEKSRSLLDDATDKGPMRAQWDDESEAHIAEIDRTLSLLNATAQPTGEQSHAPSDA